MILVISDFFPLPNFQVILYSNKSSYPWIRLPCSINFVSIHGFMPPYMLWTLASNVPSHIIVSIRMAYAIIIKPEGIPHVLGGTDYTIERALEVASVLVCIVSICPPISSILVVFVDHSVYKSQPTSSTLPQLPSRWDSYVYDQA